MAILTAADHVLAFSIAGIETIIQIVNFKDRAIYSYTVVEGQRI